MADPNSADDRPDPSKVSAAPTKDFFVTMLVRDIDLKDSIVDLVDNSVDGARRLRPDDDYSKLQVDLTVEDGRFTIEDNCGGIDIDIARNYAFRFGRDDTSPDVVSSIGQFGVGMKRTLFKLGEHFLVESKAAENSFTLDVDVTTWRESSDWDFEFTTFQEGESREPEDSGTKIVVTDLRPGVQEEFVLESFVNALADDVQLKHERAMSRGLAISINGTRLKPVPLELVENEALIPARWSRSYNGDRPPVEVSILAGVSTASQTDAGWYVFCNDRLVVRADQSALTVWGDDAGLGVPKLHPEYYEFRGYVFFSCTSSSRLPWTTTKTGVDEDSKIWRQTRRQMGAMSKEVVKFLRLADRQGDAAKNAGEDDRADLAQKLLRDAKPITIEKVVGADHFTYPEVSFEGLEATYQFIRYRKPREDFEQVRELLGVDSPGDVGERTFDYYFDKFGGA